MNFNVAADDDIVDENEAMIMTGGSISMKGKLFV